MRVAVPLALLLLAAFGWWWSVRMAGEMGAAMGSGSQDAGAAGSMASHAAMGDSMASSHAAVGHSLSFAAFVVGWATMMAAMMFPAIAPVVRLYSLAAAKGRVAPLPFFVVAYLVVWTVLAVPAYLAWRLLDEPLSDGAPWAGRLAGAVLLAAAAWQVAPLKEVCLRHCRSPLSFFMQYGGGASRRLGAFRMGAAHGLFCVGCCWALMAVLVAVGTMNLAWMAVLTALIFLEKNAPAGPHIATAAGAAFAATGVALLARPDLVTTIT